MNAATRYIVGTSGYSFADWVGRFYPPGTKSADMFAHYAAHFEAVELNFTYYRLEAGATLARLARVSPPAFRFWVKANQATTHRQDRAAAEPFNANLVPLAEAGKLAGVLLQFPQSFHRTVAGRKYLAAALDDLAGSPLAVEFRHRSWQHPATVAGLRQRGVTLVVPDVPDLPDLYRSDAQATSRTGYLRLHSRTAENWYAGGAKRYDYDYNRDELASLARQWSALADPVDEVYVFFNNCHRGQAADNAEAFRKVLAEMA